MEEALKPSATSSSPPLPLQQAISSRRTNFTNFLQTFQPKNISRSPGPASISKDYKALHGAAPGAEGKNLLSAKKSAMSGEDIDERLAGVPVFALSNASREFVLVSGTNTGKSLGLFCFSESDAEMMLRQMKASDPSMSLGSQVVPVALSKVFQLKVDGVALRLLPEASQIRNALKVSKDAGFPNETFPGVPVFQSRSLILRSEDKRYRPVFFRKEDLEKSMSRAARDQNLMNPAMRGDIQVAVLEDMIRVMKDGSVSAWDDVVFIPPGFDVSIASSQKS